MRIAIYRKTLLWAGLFAIAFTIFLAHASEPVAALKPYLIVDEDAPVDPLPPDDDPDAPIDPPIPDPYAGMPESPPVDEIPIKGEWIRVTFEVYSGLPNPSVLLASGNDFESVEQALGQAIDKPETILDAYSPESRLGYNGIRVERFSEGVARYSYTVQGKILSTGSEETNPDNYAVVSDRVVALESTLLSIGTAYKALNDAMLAVIEETRGGPAR